MTERLDAVPGGFDTAARRYDLLTGMNPGYRRHLATAADALAAGLAAPGASRRGAATLLDLGCGSGASTRAVQRAVERRGIDARIVGVDNSAGMLRMARGKNWPATVTFRHASVAEPETLAGRPGSIDGAFAAYLFRNLTDPDAALRQLHRLLRPGGRLVIVDYSVADSRAARAVWTAVCRGVVIPMSVLVGGNPQLYRYLLRSVRQFDGVERFGRRCAAAGFCRVQHRTVTGWQRGILHVWRMTRPV